MNILSISLFLALIGAAYILYRQYKKLKSFRPIDTEDRLSLLKSFTKGEQRDLYALNCDLQYVFFNDRHKLGMKKFWDKDIAIGINKTDLLPQPYQDQFRKLYQKALKGDTFSHTQKFGDEYFTFQLAPLKNGDTIEGLTAQVHQATEKILYEQELEKHQEDLENLVIARAEEVLNQRDFFQHIIDEDPNMIFVRNEEGKYVLVNKSLADIYHRSVNEVVGKKMDSFQEIGDVERYLRQDREILNGTIENLSEEEKVSIDGTEHWYLVKKKKIEVGDRQYVLGVQSDITHLKLTHQQLEEANQELQKTLSDLREMQFKLVSSEKIASIGLLTAGLVHEINNPINYVSGNVEPLKRDFDEVLDLVEGIDSLDADMKSSILTNKEEITELLNGIQEGANRVKDLISNLKSLSNTSNGKYEFCDVNRYLKSAVKLISSTTGGKIRFEEKYTTEARDIFVDPNQLNQIFLNMLDLVVLDVEEGGIIKVSTDNHDNEVVINMENNGPHYDEKALTQMIDPFDHNGGSQSLGLALSYKMITNLGGHISNENKTGDGNCFRIVFPVKVV